MKTYSADALNALEAGEAVVMGAVEIIAVTAGRFTTRLVTFADTFDYQIIDSIVDADPAESVVPPSSGFDSSGQGAFGHIAAIGPMVPDHPILTAWLPQTSLWVKKDFVAPADGALTLTGHIENGAVFFVDDVLVGSANAANAQLLPGSGAGLAYSIETPVTAGAHTLKVLALDEIDADETDDDNTYFVIEADLAVAGAGAGDPIRLWGGYGTITLDTDSGPQDFQGIGARGLIQQRAGALGGVAQGLVLAVSAVEDAALALLDASEIRAAAVVARELIFDSTSKTLLDSTVVDRGRVDTVATARTVGGDAAVNVAVESAARGLGRRGERTRSDFDQKLITGASNDNYYRNVPYAGEKYVYWNGKKPAIVGGSSSGGGGSSGALLGLSQSSA